jgi:tetratricopeptide (TPR) repeat protein
MANDATRLVDAAAVLCSASSRHDAGVRELEDLARLDAASFRTSLEDLCRCGVLRVRDGRVSFSAELIRRLAYAGQVPSGRRVMHSRAARLLRRTDDSDALAATAFHQKQSGKVARGWKLAAASVLVATLITAAWYRTQWNVARVPARTPVLLADVVNLTGDTAFDQTLNVAASVGLQQSRQVSLFPRSRVRETLALMQRTGADSMVDETLAREIAVRENLRRVVHVTVARVNQSYLVAGRVIDPSSGADLFTHQERVDDRGEVLQALDRVLGQIRRGVGESTDSIRVFSVPLPRVTTSSLPALQAYANAVRDYNARRYTEAELAFMRAVELDSSFALAWLALADLSFQQRNDRAQANAALATAERHSDRLTERERLRLALSSARLRGDAGDELVIAGSLARRFPEAQTWFNLGNAYLSRRNCADAIASFEKALGFDSTFVAAHLSSATCHQFLGASDRAIASYNRAFAVDSLSVYQGFQNHQYGVALVRGELLDSARAVYQRMIRQPASQDQQFGHRSLAWHSMWTGHWHKADAHFDTAAQLAHEAETPLSVFRNRILQADLLMTAQQQVLARQALDKAWSLREKIPIAPAFAMYAGLAFVRAGQLDRATAMLRKIDESIRQASSDDRTVRAILAARVALAQNRIAAARSALESATDTTRSDYTLPALIDVFVASGHHDSALVAATRFESRAVFGIDAQDAWLRNLLAKGRIAEQLGQMDVATTAYARLESQLKSGDADHPLLIEARKGLARLAVIDARVPVRR